MVDIARELCLNREHLLTLVRTAEEAGYDSIGLYLEHRFAFECTPWAHGIGAIQPDDIRWLQKQTDLQIIPFINLLGHFEGFLYTEEGKVHRAELMKGLQACASKPEFVELAKKILRETIEVFDSEEIHIGGDETAQLDSHPLDKARIEAFEGDDGKAMIYGEHFGPLAEMTLEMGRTPSVWADMFSQHPTALDHLPKETILYDWQYFSGCAESAKPLKEKGFKVVGSPTLHIYNAAWAHLPESEKNIRDVSRDCRDAGLDGVCMTTWEYGLFGSLETTLPAVQAAAGIIKDPDGAPGLIEGYKGDAKEWAELMGIELNKLGAPFKFTGIRSGLKCRLLLYGNPFLAWMHHADELCGETGQAALTICDQAMQAAPSEAEKSPVIFTRSAIEFVLMAEKARRHYAQGETEAAISALAPTRYLFDTLEKTAKRNHERFGASLADVERCRKAKLHVETVMQQIRSCGKRELGYLPAFEIVTNPRFTAHDQGCWWLINRWANE
jgi:hypothetical protein